MPIRSVKQYSDRGKIKDLTGEPEVPPTSFEQRAKRLFDYDKNLQTAAGFITTDYIADKNALPLSVYRIRQIVDDIKSKSSGAIDQLSQELSSCITVTMAPEAQAYWDRRNTQVKTASVRKPPVFWRARKE